MHVKDVHRIQLKRAATNHETYKMLFTNCCERIRVRASTPGGGRCITFQVVPFVWGRPPFKHAHAVRYVTEKLQRNGFEVHETHPPGMLRVCWAKPSLATAARSHSQAPKHAAPKAQHKLSTRLEALRRQLG